MARSTVLVGIAVTLAAAIGGLGVLSAQESKPAAVIAPAVLAYQADVAPVRAVAESRPGCAGQAWPHVAPECLAAADGTPARKIVRTIALSTQ